MQGGEGRVYSYYHNGCGGGGGDVYAKVVMFGRDDCGGNVGRSCFYTILIFIRSSPRKNKDLCIMKRNWCKGGKFSVNKESVT